MSSFDYRHEGTLARLRGHVQVLSFSCSVFLAVFGCGTHFAFLSVLFSWGFRRVRAKLFVSARVCSKSLTHLNSHRPMSKGKALELVASSPFYR